MTKVVATLMTVTVICVALAPAFYTYTALA